MLWLLLEGLIVGRIVLYFKGLALAMVCVCCLMLYLLRDK